MMPAPATYIRNRPSADELALNFPRSSLSRSVSLPEPLDDDVQRLVGVLAGGVVGHAERFVVGLLDARLVDEQIDDQIDLVVGTGGGQRAEDPHRADLAGQRVQQAEGDGRLSGEAFG